ncbi:DEAD/DEAH box helicase [Brachybacterium squillarum]|uniref:DEAD/DEAH box helicase n=1 Tax=Brachybacterium squillarum TaxID=661979 RepID=UPI000262996B|nr:DEAD/DEAH box helicase [Brachybacterium squillarum]
MAELLPTRQAAALRRAVTDYVTTAISLADPSVDSALDAFLTDPAAGIFLGPYLRTRLPFAESAAEVPVHQVVPSLPADFTPYAHQAAAFDRLSTVPRPGDPEDRDGFRLPRPTVVTTGTGSGKTESFLYPVLDHAARARAAGVGGLKALVLYPMNALANDQASRLARTITGNPAYRGISAALYTGEAGDSPSTTVTADGLVTDREMIRRSVPDILLTNYKMLDQLLLRRADRPLWDASGDSLRYLVLDEFHTYDGAQGTDVGMLLRRLRIVLEAAAHGPVHLTPVATSATLGDGEDAARAMLDFAGTVTGVDIDPSAVITETRVDLDAFTAPPRTAVAGIMQDDGLPALTAVTPSVPALQALARTHLAAGGDTDPTRLLEDVLDALWRAEDEDDSPAVQIAARGGVGARDLALAHPVVREMLDATRSAVALTALGRRLFPASTDDRATDDATSLLLAALSHLRATAGRNAFPSVEAHLWIREVTRVDRLVTTAPAFTWSDTAGHDDTRALPAIHCRHCGRSGWGVTTRAVGDDLDLRPDAVREDAVRRTGRFRALIQDTTLSGTGDGTEETASRSRRRHLNLDTLTLDRLGPVAEDADSSGIPVLVHAGADADDRSLDQSCPACDEKDGIRFLGSRVATLLSVTLTSLFGTPGLDLGEKKALVFTDSVQDAAHRAGFVEARSHGLSLRSVIHGALTEEPTALESIVERMLDAAVTPEQRYRLLHPTIAGVERLRPFWQEGVPGTPLYSRPDRRRARESAARRLAFDVGLELGLTGQVGRTLLLTGSARAQVRATDAELDAAADRALAGLEASALGDDRRLRRLWVRGVLERLRTRGAVSHPWLRPFRESGGMAYRLWGGRPDPDLMTAFPPDRARPGLPALGALGDRSALEDLTDRRGWYTDWTMRVLGRVRGLASSLLRPLLESLRDAGVLDEVAAKDGGGVRSFALLPDRIEACRPPGGPDEPTPALACTVCGETVTGTAPVLEQLEEGNCPRFRCDGELRPHPIPTSYYRSLYAGDMRRVVAREHTSLLENVERLAHETAFKRSHTTPGSPNVLVATPTLEMGIDIGDLSTVLLASVPRTVASYLQRVGRAGRLTGNSLDITFVAGRGRAAGVFADPLDMLNGTVRAPGAYLSAEEILRRQFIASVFDALAGDDRIDPPTPQRPVLASSGPGTFLGALLEEMSRRGNDRIEAFLGTFAPGEHAWDGLTEEAREDLRAWARTTEQGSGLQQAVHDAVRSWNAEREELRRRRAHVQQNLAALAELPTDEERAAAIQALTAESLLISAEQEEIGDPEALSDDERRAEARRLRGSAGRVGAEVSALESAHWIGVLERFALLPNFTLVDDAVALDATLIWQDEAGHWQHEASTITRSGRPALTELAPGSHFYAHGRDLVVDAVDIGVDGHALQDTAFCPVCGRVVPFADTSPPVLCPGCGDRAIGDPGQHRAVVDLRRVYSTMTRNRSRITDSSEDRVRMRWETAVSVAFDHDRLRHRWTVPGLGLGVDLHRGTTLTRLNLGAPHQASGTLRISGEDRSAPGFLLCAECGHHDSDTGGNRPQDHQSWCGLRYAREGRNRAALLARTVTTETVLMTLPRDVLDDPTDESLWNLVGAWQLGIERRFGGSIGSLDLDVVPHPDRAGERALLLSDAVPGGTGYLMELAEAPQVWSILVGALDALRDCACQEEGLAACHRCLLPQVPPPRRPLVRRDLAVELLEHLLGQEPDAERMGWEPVDGAADQSSVADSDLERRFRLAFRDAASALPGADVATRSSDRGQVVTVRLGGRVFTITPQVDVAGTRPDFVLTWPGADVEGIAVYTDGRTFHASGTHNRVADDAVKRMRLRRHGYLPLAVTRADLDERARRDDDRSGGTLPDLLVDRAVAAWEQRSPGNRDTARLLTADPIDLLLAIMRAGSTDPLVRVAAPLPFFFVYPGNTALLGRISSDDAPGVALGLLDGKPLPEGSGGSQVVGRCTGELSVVASIPAPGRAGTTTLVLDDRPAAVEATGFAESWRTWGLLANLAQGHPAGDSVVLTTASLVVAGHDVTRDAVEESAPVPARVDIVVPQDWQQALDDAITDTERQVLRALSSLGVEAPVVGEEFGAGIPLDLAWPERRRAFVAEELPPRDREHLESEGWLIVGPSTENVAERLGLTGGTAHE